ncbi:hypothetical protein SNEBB_001585 [Seison nebaliae]|nr:hypothetical protein SNEBB_001585 [Seison nebaliae]
MINYIGIDIGTTSTKLYSELYDSDKKKTINQNRFQLNHESDISLKELEETFYKKMKTKLKDEMKLFHEQSVQRHLATFIHIVGMIDNERVRNRLGVSGQMHGVVLLNRQKWQIFRRQLLLRWKELLKLSIDDITKIIKEIEMTTAVESYEIHSNLINWQDQRTIKPSIKEMKIKQYNLDIFPGSAYNTLLWFEQYPKKFYDYNFHTSIMDLCLSLLKEENNDIHISNQILHSFSMTIDNEYYRKEKNLLIDLTKSQHHKNYVGGNSIAGKNYQILPASFGDLQAAVLSIPSTHNYAMINISTSSQIVFNVDIELKEVELPPSLKHWPFVADRNLYVCASLNGGNVLAWFVNSVKNWFNQLAEGSELNEEMIWKNLNQLSHDEIQQQDCFPKILWNNVHSLFSERNVVTTGNCSLAGIDLHNFSDIRTIFASLCFFVTKNLIDLATLDIFKKLNVTTVYLTGSALLKNVRVERAIKELLKNTKCEVRIEHLTESSIGLTRYQLK